jgi:protein gp37
MPTKIEWAEESWNPVTGCTPVSEGCRNCYARRMARRLAGRCGYPEAPHHFGVTLHPDRLEQPLRWKKPRVIFACSMGDLFHEDVPDAFVAEIWMRMALAERHTFLVLTKRPERMEEFVRGFEAEWSDDRAETWREFKSPLPSVWLGVSIENQKTADERVPPLLQTPAAVRFVSCEPLLGPVNLSPYLANNSLYKAEQHAGRFHYHGEQQDDGSVVAVCDDGIRFSDGVDLHWLIVGGESGPGARPMHPDWAQSLRDQAQAAGIPFFFKQWGSWLPNDDRYGADPGYHYNSRHICLNQAGDSFDGWMESSGEKIVVMARATKRAAGRLLDRREWNEMPKGTNDG